MKEPRRRNPKLTSIYCGFYPALVELANGMGYALCVHGSMATDFDLLAVPWVDDAPPAEDLVEALAKRMACLEPFETQGPQDKPHGRRAWSLLIGGEMVIDLSVMPRRPA